MSGAWSASFVSVYVLYNIYINIISVIKYKKLVKLCYEFKYYYEGLEMLISLKIVWGESVGSIKSSISILASNLS